eukprot:384578-Pelagomonas_calceolata.AAC.2
MPASPATTAVPASPAAYPVQTTSSGPPRCVPPASDAGAGWCASAPLPRPPLATAAAAAADVAGAELGVLYAVKPSPCLSTGGPRCANVCAKAELPKAACTTFWVRGCRGGGGRGTSGWGCVAWGRAASGGGNGAHGGEVRVRAALGSVSWQGRVGGGDIAGGHWVG